jgi:hypothetical protein
METIDDTVAAAKDFIRRQRSLAARRSLSG